MLLFFESNCQLKERECSSRWHRSRKCPWNLKCTFPMFWWININLLLYVNLKDCCVLWLSVYVKDFHHLKINVRTVCKPVTFSNLLLLGKHSGCRHADNSNRINYTATINKRTDILKCACGDCFHKHSLVACSLTLE